MVCAKKSSSMLYVPSFRTQHVNMTTMDWCFAIRNIETDPCQDRSRRSEGACGGDVRSERPDQKLDAAVEGAALGCGIVRQRKGLAKTGRQKPIRGDAPAPQGGHDGFGAALRDDEGPEALTIRVMMSDDLDPDGPRKHGLREPGQPPDAILMQVGRPIPEQKHLGDPKAAMIVEESDVSSEVRDRKAQGLEARNHRRPLDVVEMPRCPRVDLARSCRRWCAECCGCKACSGDRGGRNRKEMAQEGPSMNAPRHG